MSLVFIGIPHLILALTLTHQTLWTLHYASCEQSLTMFMLNEGKKFLPQHLSLKTALFLNRGGGWPLTTEMVLPMVQICILIGAW